MSVMNIKRGTQAFTKNGQASSLKSEGAEATADFKNAFGEQSLGDVLNKVANPNWVDPSKQMRAVGSDKLDKDAFMKMMLAQMKHQDPTNPLQSHEMAAQLAQFTSVEQLTNINQTLAGMSAAQGPESNYQALALIGKKVSGDSSKLTRAAGDTKHDISFELMNDAQKVKLVVKDTQGNDIRTLDFGEMKKGRNALEWNGLGTDGVPARPGEYRFSIEAKASTGQKIHAKTSFDGRITGMNFTPQGPVLMVGTQTIKLSDVKKIEEVGPEEMTPAIPLGATQMAPLKTQQMPQSAKPIDQSKEQSKAEEEYIPPAEEMDPKLVSNLENVPMSQGLLNKLEKAAN
jgi:flagellar basal-body rod modification protein FlgD